MAVCAKCGHFDHEHSYACVNRLWGWQECHIVGCSCWRFVGKPSPSTTGATTKEGGE